MKLFLLLVFLPLLATAGMKELKDLSVKVSLQLKNGRDCIPHFNTSGYQMCGGTQFTTNQLNEIFNLDLLTCKSKITQFGHKIYDPKSNTLSKEYADFKESTMRALVLHDKNTVFFKKDLRSVDCIHELLHIHQRESCNGSKLCPKNRNKTAVKFLSSLNGEIDRITAFEKKGDKKNAKIIADSLKPYISIYGQLVDAINWLDEKDVHFFIYHRCNRLKCTSEDKEIALANLFRFKKYFPSRFNNYIVREAARIIREKENEVLPRVKNDWVKLNSTELKEFSAIKYMSIHKLVEIAKGKGIELKRISLKLKSRPFGVTRFDDKQISTLKFVNLKNEFYAKNLELQKFDGATMVCSSKRRVIILAKGATFEQFLREFYIGLLSKKNNTLCTMFSEKRSITKSFNKGKLDRTLYDTKIIRFKAIKRIASSEFFINTIGHSGLSEDSQLSIYPRYFLNQIPSSSRFPKRTGIISFSEKDDLPRVMVNGAEVVLDFGAMNSVLPVRFFSQAQLDSAEMVKAITLRTSYKTSGESPVLLFGDEISVGGGERSETRFALFDLNLSGISGLLGIDFFMGNDFTIYPPKKEIIFSESLQRPDSSLSLNPDFGGGYSSLEFNCNDSLKVRLDSGSQFEGEMAHTIGKVNYNLANKGSGIPCGEELLLRGKFILTGKNPILFDRGISLNLGWPWIKTFSQIQVSLKSGWINFIR